MIRKYLLLSFAGIILLALVSWGYVGHQVIARVAENHLSGQAKAAVHELLGSESIVEVASWADEVRDQPEYKTTASWHFLNLPLGLNYASFEKVVKGQSNPNVYSAILAQEKTLQGKNGSREQKIIALKFLVHLIGDAHQPMHISRAEDKGGNTIQVQYEGKGTNLHSLWDSRLIGKEGLGYSELATKIDQPSAVMREAANTDPVQWAWESYQISSKLYPEIEKSNKLDGDYYEGHIGTVNERLELAGLRLAAVLNALFKNTVIPAAVAKAAVGTVANDTAATALKIDVKDAASYIGKRVILTGKAFSHSDKGSFVLVNLGAEYPGQLLTLLLRCSAKTLAENIDGKMLTVTGKIIQYKGRPEIEIRNAAKLTIR